MRWLLIPLLSGSIAAPGAQAQERLAVVPFDDPGWTVLAGDRAEVLGRVLVFEALDAVTVGALE